MQNTGITQKPERDSGMELLRIVAMSMILIYHFFLHASDVYTDSNACKYLVTSFLLGGVNIFVMISGYYGIKMKVSGLVNLYIISAMFIVINIILDVGFGINTRVIDIIKSILFPFSSGGYWYLSAYIGLYFTAPLITPGLSALPLVKLRKLILVFAAFNIFSCGMLGNLCNTNGFTYMQFVFLYILGLWISQESFDKISPRICLISALVIGVIEFAIECTLYYGLHHSSGYFTRYNNIFVVLQSMCILIAFSKFKIASPVINRIALAALGCYLLQDGLFGYHFLYPYLKMNDNVLLYIIAFFLIWFLSYSIMRFKNSYVNGMIDYISSRIHHAGYVLGKRLGLV